MFEIISQINDLIKRVGKLESLETPFKSYGLWANRPTAPFSGQRFFATDRSIEYFWDGTRWLSTAPIEVSIIPYNFSNPGGPGTLVSRMAMQDDYDIWLEKLQIYYVPTIAQSGTNFYTVTATALTTFDTKLNTTGSIEYRPALTFTPAVYAATNKAYAVTFTATAAPGTISIVCKLRYRLIG